MPTNALKSLVRSELEELTAYKVPATPPAVKLDANESPWSLPGEAWERIIAAVRDIDLNRYPDGGGARLREALAARWGGEPTEYVVGTGSDEVIALLATALCSPRPGQDRPVVVFPEPTFVMYAMISRAHGWQPMGVPLDDEWDLDLKAMSATLEREQPSIVYYASPNNPTGNRFSEDRLQALVRAFPNTLHVIDEAYVAYASDTAASWCAGIPQCALLGTLSKVGLAAIRIGWVRLDPVLAYELEKVRLPYNLNSVSQSIASLALTELAPALTASVAAIVSERARLIDALARHPSLVVFPSEANFVLVRYGGDVTGLCEQLHSREIAVRAFSSASTRLAGCVRITVGTPQENDRLLEALDEIL